MDNYDMHMIHMKIKASDTKLSVQEWKMLAEQLASGPAALNDSIACKKNCAAFKHVDERCQYWAQRSQKLDQAMWEGHKSALHDCVLYGVGFEHRKPDGSVEHLPADEVTVVLPPHAFMYMGQFKRDELEGVCESLEAHPKGVNVGPIELGQQDTIIETGTSIAARFIRAFLHLTRSQGTEYAPPQDT